MPTVEVSPRVKLSDPKPAYCSMCARGADAGFRMFDCQAAFDGGNFIGADSGEWIAGSDDLHLCESCVKELCEAAGMRPETNRRQLNEIKRLEIENEHLRATIKKLQDALSAWEVVERLPKR